MSAADSPGVAVPFCGPTEHRQLLPLLLHPDALANISSTITDTHLLVLRFSRPIAELALPPFPEENLSAGPDTFRRRGRVWQFIYRGTESFLPSTRGLAYLHHLLAHPHEDIDAQTLVRSTQDTVGLPQMSEKAAREHGLAKENDLGPLADSQTLHAARTELRRLEGEIHQAETMGDDARARRLKDDKTRFLAYLAQTTNVRGRSRRAGSKTERARQSSRVAIVEAIKAIQNENRPLAEHLRSCVRTGTCCRYTPAQPVSWRL